MQAKAVEEKLLVFTHFACFFASPFPSQLYVESFVALAEHPRIIYFAVLSSYLYLLLLLSCFLEGCSVVSEIHSDISFLLFLPLVDFTLLREHSIVRLGVCVCVLVCAICCIRSS